MPSLKERDLNSALEPTGPQAGGIDRTASANRQQPVALEIPVTVNGARQLDGNDKREPFSESTKTVLVFDTGAVIRLGSAVAPGQLLFLTNEKTKKEVVCQVLKSKNYSNANGYVEVQFTEPVSGFWGLRFPTDHGAIASGPRTGGETSGSAYSGGGIEGSTPMVVAAQVEAASPAAERFKAELQAENRASSRADLFAPAEPPIEAGKPEANRLQDQLSTMLFAEQQSAPQEKPTAGDAGSKALSETTAKLFELAAANAIGAPPQKAVQPETSTREKKAVDALPAEELKVPSWLEPLARNAASPAPVEEERLTDTAAPSADEKNESQQKPDKPSVPKSKAVATPVFGNTLLGQSASRPTVSSGGSNKGLLITTIAAGVLVAAAGVTWYLRRASEPAPVNPLTVRNVLPAVREAAAASTSVPASTDSSLPSSEQTVLGAQNESNALAGRAPQNSAATSPVAVNAGTPAGATQSVVRPAMMTEKVAKPNLDSNGALNGANATTVESVESDPKKPSLGKVRLAKPKVSRNRQSNGIAEPTLTAGEDVVPAQSSLGTGLLSDNASQPAAPTAPAPVGGDVKPAKLISTVPPVYPPMARSQHVAGDVRIDALIDAHGRVSAMKVVSGPTILQQAAMDALRQWKYEPATLNGNAVAMHLTVTIQFHLQ